MATRNLVPQANDEGKIGISGRSWAEINATVGIFNTLKVSSLKLNSVNDLSLFTNGPGIKNITTNVNDQFVISLDETLISELGFNADGTKPDFQASGTVAAQDSIISAINKLDAAVSNVTDPADLDINNFSSDSITTSAEVFVNNDTTLMTSAAIDNRILSYGYTSNVGDITSIIAGTGLDLNGGDGLSGDVTIKLTNTAVNAGAYGSATQIPTFTVDAQGRLTAAGTEAISTSFSITDNADIPAIDIFNTGETLTFAGGTALSTAVTNNKVTISLDNTTVTAGVYGSATEIPTFTVDAQGRLTAAGTVGVTTVLTVDTDGAGTQDVSLADDDLQILGGVGLTSSIVKAENEVTVTLNLDNTAVNAGAYGSATQIPTFTVDAQGRLTQAEAVNISIASSQINDATSASEENRLVLRDESGDFSAGTITATLSGNASTASKWASAQTITLGGDLSGNVSLDGSQDVTLTATIAENSVALGTDTTGDYVSVITSGNGLTSTGAATGEGIAHHISVTGVLEDLNELGAATEDGEFIVATGPGEFAYESGNTARTSLGLGTGDSPEFSGLTLDNQGSLILQELNDNAEGNPATVKSISIQAPAQLTSSYSLTLPANDGDLDQILTTNGAGVLSWSTVNAIVDAVDSFSTISVAEQQDVVSNGSEATLTLAKGSGISITTAAETNTITIAASNISNDDIALDAEIVDTKLATISTDNKVSLTALDIDAGTDIGSDLADNDLIIVDDNAVGVNRKSELSRLAAYIRTKDSDITTLSGLTTLGSIGNTITTLGSLDVDQNLTVTGNLTVNGDQFIVDGTTVQLDDNLIELGLVDNLAPTVATTKDLGLLLHRHDGVEASKLGFYWDESADKFKLETGITETEGVIDAGGAKATLVADIEGSLLGNADTASILQTARTIEVSGDITGSAIFNGSADVNIVTTIGAGSVENSMLTNDGFSLKLDGVLKEDINLGDSLDFISGQNIDISYDVNNNALTVALEATIDSDTTGNAATSTSWSNSRTITFAGGEVTGGFSVDGSADVGNILLTISDNSVTNNMLFGSIQNSKLVNDSVSFGGVEVELGASNAQPAFDLTNANNYPTASLVGTITNAQLAGSISNDKLAQITADNKVALSAIDLNSATALDNPLVAADLIFVDDGANGTNRKATLTQLVNFLQNNTSLTSLNSLASIGTITSGVWRGTPIDDAYVANDLTINGGTVNSTIIGAASAAAGTFTTLIANTSFVINGSTAITSIDTNISDVSANDDTLASAKAIKTYVDAQITAQSLDVSDGTNNIDIDLDGETLTIEGGSGITSSASGTTVTLSIDNTVTTLSGEQTLTNKTLASPVASGLSLSDSSIVFEGSADDEHELTLTVENPTADVVVTIPAVTDTLVGKATTDTLTNKTIDADDGTNSITNLQTSNLKAGVLDTDLTTVSVNDDTLASAKAIKAYVDGNLGRFGGIFLTDDVGGGDYDVVFDSSPLIRSHFGPFAFDLGQLHTSGGSDIIFYGATAVGASDRHFLVIGTGENKGDCLFTGADANTP